MSQKLNSAIAVIGIDIGKNSFHLVGHDQRGAIVLRQKWSRGQVETRLANLPPCLIGMEACVGAHHLSRKLQLLGHDARLMPAKYVRPYSKGQKNDFRDAEAIAEAVQRPTMKFVATKTAEQLDLQALHRVRERLVSQRTGIINQIRAFLLERGIAVRQGLRFLRAELPGILATRSDVLSPRMLRLVEDLAGDWRRLDARIEGLSGEIEALARQDQACVRLMTVPGIGPIISSAMVDRHRRRVLQGPRLRRLARAGPEANLDGRPDYPRRHIKARQSLSARPVRSGGLGCVGQARAKALAALWTQVVDRGGEEATASQRARHCAGQQARPHRLGGSQQGARLRVRQDHRCDGVPTSVILAPCSGLSRRGLAA
jgi:transposase